ncbi:Glucokinase [Dissulfuribacter thermophilus]|uniref:Glucokinase n=1 Tax=Dissulfuribacter thermophilus TaxID=1156395 RepID=A0A1B9F3M1_9BACT|nr:glucokinase [Dissulfuribacter thermophilus]OCC14526.1 Glucokinase [Dissulfuribacter thermophilus]
MIIVADVGGTNTRLALFKGGRIEEIKIYPSNSFRSFEEILSEYLKTIGHYDCEAISIGIAGTVSGSKANCVNLSWGIEIEALQMAFDIPKVVLMNDFEAAAWGVIALSTSDLLKVGGKETRANSPRAILGAGTGLGEAIIIPCNNQRFHVLPTEGGHTEFAPCDETEWHLFQFLKEKYGHVSIERVVSGPGLKDIFLFLSGNEVSPQTVVELALQKRDENAMKALEIFIKNYGKEAANLALKSLAFGGVYIAGGIAPKIKEVFAEFGFRDAFEDKGRMKAIVRDIPVFIVLHPYLGLLGAGIRLIHVPT